MRDCFLQMTKWNVCQLVNGSQTKSLAHKIEVTEGNGVLARLTCMRDGFLCQAAKMVAPGERVNALVKVSGLTDLYCYRPRLSE